MDLHRPDVFPRLGVFMPPVTPHDYCRRAQLLDRAQARLARVAIVTLKGRKMAIPMTVFSEFQFLDPALLHVLSHSRQGGTYVRYPQAMQTVDIEAGKGV